MKTQIETQISLEFEIDFQPQPDYLNSSSLKRKIKELVETAILSSSKEDVKIVGCQLETDKMELTVSF